MERLEDRVLFDAVPDGSFLVPGENADTPQIVFEQTDSLQQADHLPRELILIDAGVQGSHDLLQSILAANPDQAYEVRYIDGDSSGIDQVSGILAEQKENPYSAVHVISHGEAGRVQLGNSFIDAASLRTQAADFAQWGNSLTADADLLFYGCNLAGNESGKTLISTLAQLTGADVAASDDLTGNATLGGDWDLEHRIGSIQTTSFKVQSWSGTLAFAVDDANAIQANNTGSATGNVLNNDSHSGGTITEVHAYASQVGTPFQLNYGTITLNADGSYAYDVNENHAAVIGLRAGDVLEEILSYEVTDSSSDTGVLVINIIGVEDTLAAADDFDTVTTVVDPVATGNVITDTGSGFDIYDRGLSQLIWENEYSNGAAVNGTSRTIDGITVGITTSDPDGAGSFSNQTVSYGTNGGHSGYLRHSLLGGADPASEVTTNISFSSEVYSLSFILADIDRDPTAPVSWQDQFSVVGTLGGVPVSFSALVAGTITESPSGTFYGDGWVPPSEAHGNVNIVFDGAVDSVTITYKQGPSLTTTTAGILGAVSDLNWQPPINVFVSSIDGSATNVGTPYAGQYGTFLIQSDGSYTYTVDDSNPDVIALGAGESLQDTVQYTLENTIGQTSTAVVTMTVNGINEPPQLDIDASEAGTGFSASFTEGAGPVNVTDTDVLITDADNTDTAMASLTITTNSISDGANEVLTFHGDLGASIAYSLDAPAATQQITVNGVIFDVAFDGTQFSVTNSTGADMPNAALQSLIAGITYNNTSPTPTTGSRTFSFVINDGTANSNTATSTISVSASADSAVWSINGTTTIDEGGIATYDLALNNPLRNGETAQIDITLNAITANSSDHSALTSAVNSAIAAYSGPGSLSWNGTALTFTSDGSGAMTPLTISLGIVDDNLLEGNESYSISLSTPASTTGENITVDPANDSVTTVIADTQGPSGPLEGPGLWSISGPTSSDEGSTARYTVSLSGTFGAGENASVVIGLANIDTASTDYANFAAAVSAAATATAGVTYNAVSGTLTFTSTTDGATMPALVIDLPITDDSLIEGPEDFQINLTSASSSTGVNVGLGANSSVVTTINDTQGVGGFLEGPALWNISGPSSADEGENVQYTISLNGTFGAGEIAQVEINFSDITASGSDHGDFIAALAAAAAATPNVSFNSVTGVLTFTAPSEGSSMPNVMVNLAINNDSLIEGPENYTIGLSNAGSSTGANVGIGSSLVTTTIDDTQGVGGVADGPGQWSVTGTTSVNEGTNAQYTISLSGSFGAAETANVDLHLASIDTNSADYANLITAINSAVALNPNLTFNASTGTITYTAPTDGASMSDLVIDLAIAADGLTEGDEDFGLVLSNPGSTTGASLSLAAGSGSVTTRIIDADVPNWSISGPTQADEGESIQFVISLSGTFNNGDQVSVDINLNQLSTNANDYESVFNAIATAVSSNPNLAFNTTTGTLTFTSPSDGASMPDLVVDLLINDDANIEGPEDFSLSLNNPVSTGFSVGITNATVTTQINDTQGIAGVDDGPGLWNLAGPASANEGSNAQYTISLSGTFGEGEVVSVIVNIADLTTNSSDHGDILSAIAAAAAINPDVSFDSTSRQLTFTSPADGAMMADLIVNVSISDDNLIESDEDFSIALSSATSFTGANVGIDNSIITTTIGDTQGSTGALDGPGQWSITGPTNIDEGGAAQYTIALSGAFGAGETASVEIALNDLNTINSDYGDLISAINTAVAAAPNVTFNSTTGTLTFVASADGAAMPNLIIDLPILDDSFVEGAENFLISLSNPASTSGANVSLHPSNSTVTTTINDTDGVGGSIEQSVWSITGNTSVDEGGIASYTIALSNTLQAGEAAQVQLVLTDLETTNIDYSSFITAVQNAISSRPDLSFNSTTGVLTFTSSGSLMADLTVNVTAIDDNFVEGIERFRISLANPASSTGAAIAVDPLQDDATTTIQDTIGDGGANEQVVWAIGTDQTVAEGGNGIYTLSLGNGVLQNGEQVSVDIDLIDIDTDSSDYLSFNTAITDAVAAYAGPGSLSFAPATGTITFVSDGNPMSVLNINLGTFDDPAAEGPEDFQIQLSNPTSSSGALVTIDATADDVITTIDDRVGSGADQVNWRISGDTTVDEGGYATYSISLSGLLASGETSSVELQLTDLSTNNADYASLVTAVQTAVSSRTDLSFNSSTKVLTYTGDGSAMTDLLISLAANDDTFVEGAESFTVSLTNPTSPTGASAGIDSLNNSVTTTIADTVGAGGVTESANWSIIGSTSEIEGDSINYNLSLAGILQNGETATVQLTLGDIETNSSDYLDFATAIHDAITSYTGPGVLSFDSASGILTFTSDGNAMNDLAISLQTNNDSISEGNERLIVALSNPGSTTGAATTVSTNSSVTTTLVDNDLSQWSITGPTQGNEGQTVQYQIALSGSFGAGTQTSVMINLTDISTNSTDHSSFVVALSAASAANPDVTFNSTTNTLTFASTADGSSMTPLNLSLDLTNDVWIEGPENFSIQLSNPTASSGIAIQLDATANQITTEIRDTQGPGAAADGPGQWSISGPTTVNEAGVARYTVSLSGQYGAGEVVSVNIALSDITTNSSDYGDIIAAIASAVSTNPDVTFNATSGTLRFQSPSDGTAMSDLVIELPIGNDSFAEGPEDFVLGLTEASSSTGSNVQIGNATVTTTIDDRFGAGSDQVSWALTGSSSIDEGGTASYTISLNGLLAAGETSSVQLDLADGSTTGADYASFATAVQNAVSSRADLTFNSTTGFLTFTGDGSAMINLAINLDAIDDTLIEGPEAFTISLRNPTSSTDALTVIDSINQSVSTTINDTIGDGGANESANWSIAGPTSVNEGGSINYLISLNGILQSGENASIQLTLGDIDTNTSDYQSFVAAVQNAVSSYSGPGSLTVDPTTSVLTFTGDGNAMSDITISLPTMDDLLSEGNERLNFTISNPSSSTAVETSINGAPSVTTTIIDDDISQWSISGPIQADEGEAVQYEVSLSGTFSGGIQSTVVINLNDITTNSSDRSDLVSAITIAAATNPDVTFDASTNMLTYTSPADGSAMVPLTISLNLTNDSLIEGSESYSIRLSNPTATAGIAIQLDPTANQVQTEIRDTQGAGGSVDGPGEWSISGPVTVNEGAWARYTISLNGPFGSGEVATVDVTFTDIDTDSSDYGDLVAAIANAAAVNPDVTFNPATQTLTFQSPGDGATMTDLLIDLPIVDDATAESSENFAINLSNASSNTGSNVGIAIGTANTTIQDSQQVDWSITGTTNVAEGGFATYVLSLDGVAQAGETASVNLTIGNISTTSADYGSFVSAIQNAIRRRSDLTFDSSTGTLTYTSDGTSMMGVTFSIQAIPDGQVEPNESFEIQLTAAGSSTGLNTGIAAGHATVHTIITTRESGLGDALPIATDDFVSTFLNTDVSGNLLSNDGSPNGSVFSIDTTPVAGPSQGSVTITSDGSFVYQPNSGFIGTDRFVYQIRDAAGHTDTATVLIRVLADLNGSTNDNPNVVDDGGIGQKNQPVHGDLLANDSEPNGDPLTVNTTPITSPNNGTLIIHADGTYTYTPANDFVGTDSFVYEACDTFGNCDTAVVHLTIFDSPPTAMDDINHTTANVPVSGNVLTNDSDPNENDTVSVNTTPLTGPSNGSLVLSSNGTYTYTPNPDFTGSDSFTYQICDESGNCDVGKVTIEIRETGTTNASPVANADSTVVFQNGVVSGQLLSNDGDPDGDSISLNTTPLSSPTNGTVILRADGTYTYTPNSGFIGTDSFEYQICDAHGACDTAIVTIDVVADINGAANDPPHGGNDSIIGQKNVPFTGNLLSNDSDPNHELLTINTTPTSAPSHGSLLINPDGTFTYTPDAGFTGNDSFQYEVCDDQGACTVVTAVVTVFNEPPVAVDDQFTLIGDQISGRVTDNDSEPNNDPMTASLIVRPQHGTITWQPDGTFTYMPGPSYTGNDSFVYVLCDDSGACSTAMVQLTSPFAFDAFTNQATDENAFESNVFGLNSHHRELLLSQKIGQLAPEPILAGYATPGSVLIGRIYNVHGALIAEATTHASPAGNWVMHFFDSNVQSDYVVMIEHIATEEVAMGNHHFRLTPTTYRSLQFGTNHSDAATIGTILSDTPSNSLDIWHQQNVNPLRLND